ncbi:MAG: phenylalanine--tRNA ligase subunit beta [Myxococcota bacterium]
MKIASDVLRRWVDLPEDPHELRQLLDLCGLEVKRVEPLADGATGFTLELLANRGDHHCYEGLARELYGHVGTALRVPSVTPLTVGPSPIPLRLESPLCLKYTATLLEGGGGELDPAARRVLAGSGLAPVSAPVDATNVANLELGQPTHAFDADTVEGAIVIRPARAGERAWPLFHPEPVEVPEGALVIADDRKILAIAGVIGCEESKTTAATRRLLLESATFDPVAVRKAARAMRISTDSSARFERGADPERPLVGAGRVVDLLRPAGWRVVGTTGEVGAWTPPGRAVAVDADAASAFLGVPLDAAAIGERLGRYGFSCRTDPGRPGRVVATVPSWRLWDVEFVADLYEELAKSLGYAATPVELPPVDLGAIPSPLETRRSQVEEVLLGNGFYEVFTDGFYGRDVFALMGIAEGDPLYEHVQTTNALDRGYALLKNNTLHQAILAVGVNERRRTPDVKMFEWTRTFHPTGHRGPPADRTPPCVERSVLWMVVCGQDRARAWHDTARPADVVHLKGVLAELGVELGLDLELTAPTEHPLGPYLHPGRSATITVMGEPVGVIGEVHPALCKRYKLKSARPCFVELEVGALAVSGARPTYVEPPDTQPLVRSLAFGFPRQDGPGAQVDAGDVATWIHASGPDWLERVRIVDHFEPPATDGGPPPLRAVTFELDYANPESVRTAEEVNAATEGIVRAVLDQFGPRGVHQR